MIKGILIGIGLTLIIEFIIINFGTIIIDKIEWFFNPILHPKVSLYLIKININPWHATISKIATLPDDQFTDWLNLLDDKHQQIWKKIRNNYKNLFLMSKNGVK